MKKECTILTDEMKYWLYSAIRLDLGLTIYKEYAKNISDLIFETVRAKGGLRHKKYEEVFITLITNLRVAFELNRPLRYSRRTTNYPQQGVGYTTLITIIDRLVEMGYISGQLGCQDSNEHDARQSRIWVEYKINSLYDMFMILDPDDVVKKPPYPLVKLLTRKTNVGKVTVKPELMVYKRTGATRKMEKQLYQYQELMDLKKIELHIDWDKLDNKHQIKLWKVICKNRYSKLTVIYPNLPNGNQYINSNSINIPYINNEYHMYYNIILYHTTINNTIYQERNSVTPRNHSGYCDKKDNHVLPPLPPKNMIRGIGIRLKYKTLHRSFTSNFKLGGRYYGGTWIDFSGEVRKNIFIDDEPVVEPDFSCHHLKILYDLIDIDYRDDVYTFMQPEYRKLGKAVAMGLINCKTPKSAHSTIKSMFGWKKKDGVYQVDKDNKLIQTFGTWILDKKFIAETIDSFKKTHSKLEKFIATDQGIRLQNIDSKITSDILDYFIKKGIACLPVHDSYIIAEKYKDELIEVMGRMYKKHLKYDPIIT